MRNIEGLIFTEKGFKYGKLSIDNGIISDVEYYPGEVSSYINDNTVKIIPGLVDIHLHGANGYDFCDGNEKSFAEIEKYELEHGIVCFLGATMTLGREQLLKICRNAGEYISNKEGVGLFGIYLEGPFISEKKAGAQNSDYVILPKAEFVKELNDAANGNIRFVVIAPEKAGAIKATEDIIRMGIPISLGHTEADYDITKAAYEKGAKHVTHLFNAMKEFNHRNPGIVGFSLENDMETEIIADGVHLHDSIVRLIFKVSDSVILISDSTMATGLSNGRYHLGDKNILVEGNKSLLDDGTIAGSVTNLFDCMVKAMAMGVEETKAIIAATINPAKSIGADDFYGSIEKGKCGRVLLLDKDNKLLEVVK